MEYSLLCEQFSLITIPQVIRIPDKNCVLQFLSVGCGESVVSPCLSRCFAFRRDKPSFLGISEQDVEEAVRWSRRAEA
jgi:hypothetical protein